MDCSTARELLSASLDGELDGAESRRLEIHLARCPGCRRWRETAHELTRRTRLGLVDDAPRPDPALTFALAATRHEHGRPRVTSLARAGLMILAVVQLTITVPALLFGTDHDAPVHVAHEMGSYELAIALSFLVAAWRPQLARGIRVLVGVAAVMLLATAVVDLTAGRTTLLDESPHLVTILGWAMLEVLTRRTPGGARRHQVPLGGRPTSGAAPSAAQAGPPGIDRVARGGRLPEIPENPEITELPEIPRRAAQ